MLLQFLVAIFLFNTIEVSCTVLEPKENLLAQASNDFSSKLYEKLSLEKGNLFYSPLSIATALAMLYYGARGNTAQEMRDVLGYSSTGLTNNQINEGYKKYLIQLTNSQTDYILDMANAVFAQENYSIRHDYLNGLKSIFNAEARNVDFVGNEKNVLNEINAWVRNKTSDKIQSILNSIDPSTIMILLNAVYFKGTWLTQFHKKLTNKVTFFNNGKESKQVDMMYLRKENFRFYQNDEIKVLELPYKGKDMCMRIILPVQRDGLANVETKLSSSFLRDTWGNLKTMEVNVVRMPKFKIEYKKELKGILSSLGMSSVFNAADLSGIGPNRKVSSVLHKSFVEVNEGGSEAAAVTAIIVVPYSVPIFEDIIEFIADHPFLFYIIDKRNEMILFSGRISEL